MKKYLFSFFLTLTSLLLSWPSASTWAEIIDWSGLYRLEGYYIDNTTLSQGKEGKTYGLHHFVLNPKVVISDSIVFHSRFDILNTTSFGTAANNQLGQIWGVNHSSSQSARTLAQNGWAGHIEVSQAYLVAYQEYGSLVVGRAPVHFGLGMTHNAGTGMFDHWYDTRDLIGYKLRLGHFSLFPMIAKAGSSSIGDIGHIDLLAHLQYESLHMNLDAGIFYWSRLDSGELKINNTQVESHHNLQQFNLYFAKELGEFRVAVEMAQQMGSTEARLNTSSGQKSLSSQGLILEMDWSPKKLPQLDIGIDIGYASGDDLSTPNDYEGFIFDRNYDVALLMFNHPMGMADYLQTFPITQRGTNFDPTNKADIEAISNTFYFSPYVVYGLSDKWWLKGRWIAAWLNQDPLSTDVHKDLGHELDFHVTFSPNKYVNWVTGLGVLLTGNAFQGGSRDLDSEWTFGLTSGLVVHF